MTVPYSTTRWQRDRVTVTQVNLTVHFKLFFNNVQRAPAYNHYCSGNKLRSFSYWTVFLKPSINIKIFFCFKFIGSFRHFPAVTYFSSSFVGIVNPTYVDSTFLHRHLSYITSEISIITLIGNNIFLFQKNCFAYCDFVEQFYAQICYRYLILKIFIAIFQIYALVK